MIIVCEYCLGFFVKYKKTILPSIFFPKKRPDSSTSLNQLDLGLRLPRSWEDAEPLWVTSKKGQESKSSSGGYGRRGRGREARRGWGWSRTSSSISSSRPRSLTSNATHHDCLGFLVLTLALALTLFLFLGFPLFLFYLSLRRP